MASTDTSVFAAKITVALDQKQRSMSSWLPPPTSEELASQKSISDLQAKEEAKLFASIPETTGAGFFTPDHTNASQYLNGTDSALRQKLLGKRSHVQVHNASLRDKPTRELYARKKARLSESESDDDADSDNGGRGSLGKNKKLKIRKSKKHEVKDEGYELEEEEQGDGEHRGNRDVGKTTTPLLDNTNTTTSNHTIKQEQENSDDDNDTEITLLPLHNHLQNPEPLGFLNPTTLPPSDATSSPLDQDHTTNRKKKKKNKNKNESKNTTTDDAHTETQLQSQTSTISSLTTKQDVLELLDGSIVQIITSIPQVDNDGKRRKKKKNKNKKKKNIDDNVGIDGGNTNIGMGKIRDDGVDGDESD